MKTGKIPENVLKRSVLKQRKTKRDEVVIGAGIGENCAILSFEEDCLMATTLACTARTGKGGVYSGLYHVINQLAASGAMPVAITLSALLPADTEEAAIKEIMLHLEEECRTLNVQITGARIEITDAVVRPVYTLSGTGKLRREEISSIRKIRPGQDVVVSKWIGLEGTALIAEEKREELLQRYPLRLVEEAQRFDNLLSLVTEAATAIKSGVRAMHCASEGGIFGALWEMAEGAGVGLEVDLKKLPVRQETIEVCEFFEISPYELLSGGCLIMVTDNGHDLVRALEQNQVPASIIGKTTEGNDRVVTNDEEKRYLEPSRSEELYKVIGRV